MEKQTVKLHYYLTNVLPIGEVPFKSKYTLGNRGQATITVSDARSRWPRGSRGTNRHVEAGPASVHKK